MNFESKIARAGFTALFLANSLACSSARNSGGNPIAASSTEAPITKPEPIPRVLDPILCQRDTEALRPPTLNAQALSTYKTGVLINLSSGIEILFNRGLLDTFNTDSQVGIDLPTGISNISYLYPLSLQDPALEQAKLAEMQKQILYPLYRLCQEQGVTSTGHILEVISVADAIVDAQKMGFEPGTIAFYEQASINLSLGFVRNSRKAYVNGFLNGSIDPTLSPAVEKVEKAVSLTTPILIKKVTRTYLGSIGIN